MRKKWPRVRRAGFIALQLCAASSAAHADFSGPFALSPAGCEATGECVLDYDLKYVDPKGVGWQAAAKNTTDGASIPPWAQPFIGKPFDPAYIKAAIIHDHYCGRHVRSWRDTHRVFYDALIELGIDQVNAKIMYYAVYLAGPKWVKLIPGKPCGDDCVFRVDGAAKSEPAKEITIARAAEYDKPGFADELKAVEALLKEQGSDVDLDQLQKRAEAKKSGDFYYLNGDTVEIKGDAVQ